METDTLPSGTLEECHQMAPQSTSRGSDGTDIVPPVHQGGKKAKNRRHRRAKRRRWKPYYKLTADERKALEIYEEKRAERVRAWRFKHGIPVAPYNTTQFLLNDRQNAGAPNGCPNVDEIVANIRTHTRSGSYESIGSSGSGGSSLDSDEDEDYCQLEQREFEEEYESAHAERLESMSKSDLIKDYIELEKELEHIQRESAKKTREIDDLKRLLAAKATDDDTGHLSVSL